jgi:hypothetical protein
MQLPSSVQKHLQDSLAVSRTAPTAFSTAFPKMRERFSEILYIGLVSPGNCTVGPRPFCDWSIHLFSSADGL